MNPEEYDYLWTDYDVNFIFTSCYLFKEFRNTDIILIYDWKNKGLKFFLSKEDRIRFSEYGVIFFQNKFPAWKKQIVKNIKIGNKLIMETKRDEVSLMSNQELKKKILERASLFQALGGNYFYTEFFFLDKVEKFLKEGKKIKHFDEMGPIKFKAREILNDFYHYDKIFAKYVNEVAKRLKRQDVQWLSYHEIVDLLINKKIEISFRDNTTWVLSKNTDWKLISGERAEKISIKFENYFFSKQVDEIKGTIANKGVYSGKVKIIRTLFSSNIIEEIKKVKQGDVLLAETTGPEMMIACKRAGAIITDEGGLTSHAAIVSRELRIPCIVGTKIATKILKDGDLVEVDANNGIVKIIKK